jgi:nucleoside-diphosphate-sugar epimerase
VKVALVTGASGFIGRHATAALVGRGFIVHAVARQPLSDLPVTWHQADLFDAATRQEIIENVRPTHLLHLAWEARHSYFWEAPENLDWVAATLGLVRLFHAAGGQRMVLAGSCAEYDWTPQGLGDGICREHETPLRPTTLYGMAKLFTYRLAAAFAERNGLSCAWGRIFFLFGPGEAEGRLVPSVIRTLRAEETAELGEGNRLRDFLDVRDAGAAFAALLASSVEGPVNIASGEGVTIAELVQRLARQIGDKMHLLKFGARATAVNDPERLLADISRLRDEVGFARRHDLERGLAETVRWWQDPSGQ